MWTYADLLAEVTRFREELTNLQVRPGAVVGLQADYSFTAIALLLALLANRFIVAMIPRDRAVESYLDSAQVDELWKVDEQGRTSPEVCLTPAAEHPLLRQLRAGQEAGLIIFTSGSTGRPKAALQSAERLLRKFTKAGRRLRTLAFLMFDHIAGLDTLFYTLANGATLVLTRQRDPGSILRLIDSQRVQVLPASPSFLRLLCLIEDEGRHDLSSLEVVTYGSEPMDPGTLKLMNARFPDVQLTQKYGTTETGSPRSISRGNDSLWVKLKGPQEGGVETRIVAGMLWIRSESAILGYLNAPSPFDSDGWYCTGDLVEVDGEWLRFRGRASESINVGGEKVSPVEVEETIMELDCVRDAIVEGEPNILVGHIVVAHVALAAPMSVREAARLIRQHCSTRLARYKVPVKIDIVDQLVTSGRHKKRRGAGPAAVRH
jgi:acyl-CoA synthetase (AMP-forming)/AMP-acid ligase II